MAQSLCANAPAWAADMKWHTLIEETLQLVRATNRYFENSAPWSLVKTDRDQAATVLTNCIEALRIAAVLLYPVMPGKAVDLLSRIGEPVRMLKLEEHARWGQVRVGARMRKGDALFPRLDEKEVRLPLAEYVHGEAPSVPAAAATAAPAPDDSLITIDDFRKIDLRTAEVVAAERIAGSDKLLKLQVVGTVRLPDGRMSVLLGNIKLEAGKTVPPVLPDQMVELKVKNITTEYIELAWQEKRATGLPPKLMVIPINISPKVRYQMLGQSEEDTKSGNVPNATMDLSTRQIARQEEVPPAALPVTENDSALDLLIDAPKQPATAITSVPPAAAPTPPAMPQESGKPAQATPRPAPAVESMVRMLFGNPTPAPK